MRPRAALAALRVARDTEGVPRGHGSQQVSRAGVDFNQSFSPSASAGGVFVCVLRRILRHHHPLPPSRPSSAAQSSLREGAGFVSGWNIRERRLRETGASSTTQRLSPALPKAPSRGSRLRPGIEKHRAKTEGVAPGAWRATNGRPYGLPTRKQRNPPAPTAPHRAPSGRELAAEGRLRESALKEPPQKSPLPNRTKSATISTDDPVIQPNTREETPA